MAGVQGVAVLVLLLLVGMLIKLCLGVGVLPAVEEAELAVASDFLFRLPLREMLEIRLRVDPVQGAASAQSLHREVLLRSRMGYDDRLLRVQIQLAHVPAVDAEALAAARVRRPKPLPGADCAASGAREANVMS